MANGASQHKSAALRRAGNRKWALKPQDLVMAFELALLAGKSAGLRRVGEEFVFVAVRVAAAVLPFYEKLPLAAQDDPTPYEMLALFDALRIGQARERELAGRLLLERLQRVSCRARTIRTGPF
jgi:hypothetical protein